MFFEETYVHENSVPKTPFSWSYVSLEVQISITGRGAIKEQIQWIFIGRVAMNTLHKALLYITGVDGYYYKWRRSRIEGNYKNKEFEYERNWKALSEDF